MKGNNFLFSSEAASQALLLAHDQGAGEALPHISHLDSSGGIWGALFEVLLLQQLEGGKGLSEKGHTRCLHLCLLPDGTSRLLIPPLAGALLLSQAAFS